MKTVGILLILWGIIGLFLGSLMFGDIGIACIVGAVGSILSGIGFLRANKQFRLIWKNKTQS